MIPDFIAHRKLKRAESFLTTHHCQVVISSTWRETCDESYLACSLGEIVWDRVIGFTPKLDYQEGKFQRQNEVESFAGYFGLRHFIALDDDKSEFGDDAKIHFVNRKTGLVDSDIRALENWYKLAY